MNFKTTAFFALIIILSTCQDINKYPITNSTKVSPSQQEYVDQLQNNNNITSSQEYNNTMTEQQYPHDQIEITKTHEDGSDNQTLIQPSNIDRMTDLSFNHSHPHNHNHHNSHHCHHHNYHHRHSDNDHHCSHHDHHHHHYQRESNDTYSNITVEIKNIIKSSLNDIQKLNYTHNQTIEYIKNNLAQNNINYEDFKSYIHHLQYKHNHHYEQQLNISDHHNCYHYHDHQHHQHHHHHHHHNHSHKNHHLNNLKQGLFLNQTEHSLTQVQRDMIKQQIQQLDGLNYTKNQTQQYLVDLSTQNNVDYQSLKHYVHHLIHKERNQKHPLQDKVQRDFSEYPQNQNLTSKHGSHHQYIGYNLTEEEKTLINNQLLVAQNQNYTKNQTIDFLQRISSQHNIDQVNAQRYIHHLMITKKSYHHNHNIKSYNSSDSYQPSTEAHQGKRHYAMNNSLEAISQLPMQAQTLNYTQNLPQSS